MTGPSRSLPPEPLTGLVLAGGKSSRFGSDKASAIVSGRTLLEWVLVALAPVCESLVVVRASGQVLPRLDLGTPIVIADDLYGEKGPLAGLVSGFEAVRTPLAFAASCDVPLLRSALVAGLAALAGEYDVVVPHVDGFPQPLLAIYRPSSCLGPFRQAVEDERLKITAAYAGLNVRVAREADVRQFDPDLSSFRNLNRAEDVDEIAALLARRDYRIGSDGRAPPALFVRLSTAPSATSARLGRAVTGRFSFG